MRIAILGATSQIAKDLILAFAAQSQHDLVLYARRTDVVSQWLVSAGLTDRYPVADFTAFHTQEHFDALLNFVGVGNPAQAVAMGASIFDVTLRYDELAMGYVHQHPTCRYIFLSSGAAYGASFDEPVTVKTKASIAINNLMPQDWYGVAKLHAECRHRALAHLPIVDLRIFNYFSHTQDMEARFLITDILRAIRDKTVLKTTKDYIVRDYLHPSDFCQLVNVMLNAPATNMAVDCYSLAPTDKATLLEFMQKKYGLQFEMLQLDAAVNATGNKPNYFSKHWLSKDFGYSPRFTSLGCIFAEFGKLPLIVK
jgi:nucleoside-diphosphate-sugar epimerase